MPWRFQLFLASLLMVEPPEEKVVTVATRAELPTIAVVESVVAMQSTAEEPTTLAADYDDLIH